MFPGERAGWPSSRPVRTSARPHVRATVVDLPSVTSFTQRLVEEVGVADRFELVSADVVYGTSEGSFDVAVMCALIPVISRDEAQRVLKNVRQAVEPGGTIYINYIGTLDDSRLSTPDVLRQNLRFINVFDEGQARAEQERWGWLTTVGIEGVERVNLPEGHSIMVARKPA